jgi:MFS family permease
VGGWFRHDVEDRLSTIVGGPARLRVIVLLAAVLGLDSADKATIGAVATELEHSLSIGNVEIGLLATVSTAVGLVATLPLGLLADRVNRVRLLTGAIVIWSLAMIVSGFSTSYLMLLLSQLALGAIVATAGPVVASLTGDFFPAHERGRIYSFILTGELVGVAIGFLVAGELAGALSWRFGFWVLAIPGFALAVALIRLLREPARGGQDKLTAVYDATRRAYVGSNPAPQKPTAETPDANDEGEVEREVEEGGIRPHERLVLGRDPTGRSLAWAVRYVLSIRTNLALIVASALGYFFFSGIRTFGVVFIRGRYGLGQSLASLLLVVVGLGAVVGVLIAGRTADRLIHRGVITGRLLVAGIAFAVAVVFFVPGLLITSLAISLPLFFLAAAGLGGANPPLDAARLDIMHSRLWGRAEGVRTVLRSVGEGLAPILFGIVSAAFGGKGSQLGEVTGKAASGAPGLDHTLLIMLGALAIGAVVILVRARKHYPRDVATAVASEHATQREAATSTGGEHPGQRATGPAG